MKTNISILQFILCACFCFLAGFLKAQVPSINLINKSSSTAGGIIIISGNNFGDDKNKIVVFFGSESGEVISCDNHRIEVKVPAGATYNKISVTNIETGLTAYSPADFLLSFGGNADEQNRFSEQINIQGDPGIYDLCLCDFDLDGKVDIITVQESASASLLAVYRNTSSENNLSFVKRTINLGTPSISLDCADIDGDGKPDFVVTRGGATGDRAYVYRNISTSGNINFAAPVTIANREGNVMKVLIRDLDGDGKPEITWTNNTTNNVQVNVNNSRPGFLSFSQVLVRVQGANGLRGISIADIDNDQVPDLILGSFITNDVFVVPNRSATGNVSFGNAVRIPLPGNVVEVAAADLDGDGKTDVMATLLHDHELAVFLNNSSENEIKFQPVQKIRVNNNPWGIDVGDLNGDGKTDIAVASINENQKALTLLFNETQSPGSVSFIRQDLPAQERSRNVKIGDLNQDGIPDLSFSSIDTHKLSFFLNKNCVVPELSPNGEVSICEEFPFTIKATNALKVKYRWYQNNNLIAETETNSFEASAPGIYSVKIKSLYNDCEMESLTPLNIIDSQGLLETPQADNSGPVCVGESLQLQAATIEGYDYRWTGPDNFTSSQQNPVIENIDEKMAGEYFLQVSKDGCISQQVSTFVTVRSAPVTYISSANGSYICEGEHTTLSVNVAGENSYQWFKDGQPIMNATDRAYETGVSGEYYVQITGEDCAYKSQVFEVSLLSTPEASFNADTQACVNSEITFTNTSKVASAGVEVKYSWLFGDGASASQADPVYKYASPGEYEVSLNVAYDGMDCADTYTFNITVYEFPEVHIETEGDGIFCRGDIVTLTANSNAAHFEWNTGSDQPWIEVTESGTYTVKAWNETVCISEEEITIEFLDLPNVQLDADKMEITVGDSVRLSASGASDFQWFPTATLSDSLSATIYASPKETTTYYLIGKSSAGCIDTVNITIVVEEIFELKPRKIFSPNGDRIEDEWYIEGIEECNDCKVSVFDKAGRLVFEAKPYINRDLNSWHGDYKGRPLPEGVYYYIITGNDYKTTGSVMIIR